MNALKTDPPAEDDRAPEPGSDFVWDVYRRIAADSLKRRSRQVFVRRFVLQPSLAVALLVIGLTVGFQHYRPKTTPETTSLPVMTENQTANKQELRASLYLSEFFKRQGSGQAPAIAHASEVSVSHVQRPTSVEGYLSSNSRIPDARRLLEDADLLNYSMKDRKRALAKYQRLVDNYPGTDAAQEAQSRIKGIWNSVYSIEPEQTAVSYNVDSGI